MNGRQDYETVERALHASINRAIAVALSKDTPTAKSVERAVHTLQGPYVRNFRDFRKLPYVDIKTIDVAPTAVIGFEVFCGGAHDYLRFYSATGRTWSLVKEIATTGNDRRSFASIPSPIDGEARYMSWGTVSGDPHQILRVVVYGFDGLSLRTVDKRTNFTGGRLTRQGDVLTIRYNQPFVPGAVNYDRPQVEVIRIGPAGFETLSHKLLHK